MLLYCVRHGESEFNASGRIQGQFNVGLSPLGRQQSAALAREFAGSRIDAVFASPLDRARQTAEPIAAALGLELELDDRLKELHAGIFQGLTWEELAVRYPREAERWRSYDPDFVIPEGESRRMLAERGRTALEAIRGTGLARVIVVAHGGLLTAALKSLLEIPLRRNPFALYNASISQVDWDGQFRLITLNQIDHLRRYDASLASRIGDL